MRFFTIILHLSYMPKQALNKGSVFHSSAHLILSTIYTTKIQLFSNKKHYLEMNLLTTFFTCIQRLFFTFYSKKMPSLNNPAPIIFFKHLSIKSRQAFLHFTHPHMHTTSKY